LWRNPGCRCQRPVSGWSRDGQRQWHSCLGRDRLAANRDSVLDSRPMSSGGTTWKGREGDVPVGRVQGPATTGYIMIGLVMPPIIIPSMASHLPSNGVEASSSTDGDAAGDADAAWPQMEGTAEQQTRPARAVRCRAAAAARGRDEHKKLCGLNVTKFHRRKKRPGSRGQHGSQPKQRAMEVEAQDDRIGSRT